MGSSWWCVCVPQPLLSLSLLCLPVLCVMNETEAYASHCPTAISGMFLSCHCLNNVPGRRAMLEQNDQAVLLLNLCLSPCHGGGG